MNNWKQGDVVKLKSGGPVMTVSKVLNDATVICQWFTKDELKEAGFYQESLEAHKPGF